MSDSFLIFYRNLAIYALFNLCFGLYSLFLKEKLLLTEPLVAMIFGIVCGPLGLRLLEFDIADSSSTFGVLIFHFARFVMAFQTMAAGISLPRAYLREAWKPLVLLLGPVLLGSWLVAACIICLVFRCPFVEALVLAACVTPTDPVLASSIVKGRFAEDHVPKSVIDLISAESGVNDAAALLLLYLPIFIIARASLFEWLIDIVCYRVVISLLVGLVIGRLASWLLKYSQSHQLIDKQSTLAYSLALATLLSTFMTAIGSSDILAIFMAGSVFNWQDFTLERLAQETELQRVIDSFFNSAFFVLFGAALPWSKFKELGYLPLIVLSALLLLLRRLPLVISLFSLHNCHYLCDLKERTFVGWFGPTGVSGVFYALLSTFELSSQIRCEDLISITCFVVMVSVVVHGMTAPLFQLTVTRQVTLELVRTTSVAVWFDNRQGE